MTEETTSYGYTYDPLKGDPERDAADLKAKQDALYEFQHGGWEPMETFPEDGKRCEILTDMGAIVKDIWWGQPPLGSQYTFVGQQNILSLYLVAGKLLGWRLKQ